MPTVDEWKLTTPALLEKLIATRGLADNLGGVVREIEAARSTLIGDVVLRDLAVLDEAIQLAVESLQKDAESMTEEIERRTVAEEAIA